MARRRLANLPHSRRAVAGRPRRAIGRILPREMSKQTTFLRLSAIRIAMALAVAGVGLAACEEASPPITPTPMPAAALAPAPTATPTDAREAAAQDCKAIRALDYDVTYTVWTTRQGRVATWEYRVSGGKARYVLKAVTPDGAERVVREGITRMNALLCFSHNVVARAVGLGVSSPEPHYSFDSNGELREYWVDSGGRLARSRATIAYADRGDATDASETAEHTTLEQRIVTAVYSGYGEPNVITDPGLPDAAPASTRAPAGAWP